MTLFVACGGESIGDEGRRSGSPIAQSNRLIKLPGIIPFDYGKSIPKNHAGCCQCLELGLRTRQSTQGMKLFDDMWRREYEERKSDCSSNGFRWSMRRLSRQKLATRKRGRIASLVCIVW
ncbi:Uncharacterised protein at_DN0547 [Pycnogonum litorale]